MAHLELSVIIMIPDLRKLGWIVYSLIGIKETAEETLKQVKRINEEVSAMTAEIKEKLPKLCTKELMDLLF